MPGANRRQFIRYGGAAVIGTTFAGCLGDDDPADDDTDDTDDTDDVETLTLAGTVPLTGADASTGQNVLIGYEAAVDKINEEGGVEVDGTTYELELDIRDDETNPERATPIYEEFLDAGHDFFLGSFGSATVLPTAAITNNAGAVMVQGGGGSDEIFDQGWEKQFGMFPRASLQFESSRELFETLDPQPEQYSVVYTNDPFSQFQADGAVAELEGAGFEVVGEHEIPREATDVGGVITSIEGEDPDYVITTTHDAESRLLMREFSTRQIDVGGIYQTLGPNQPGYREDLGDDAEYVYSQTYWHSEADFSDDLFGTAEGFLDYVVENFDVTEEEFEYHTATGAACVQVYKIAMEAADSLDPDAVADEIHAMDLGADESFYGPISFEDDGAGDPIDMGPLVQQILDGTLEIVYPDDAASAEAIYPMTPWDER